MRIRRLGIAVAAIISELETFEERHLGKVVVRIVYVQAGKMKTLLATLILASLLACTPRQQSADKMRSAYEKIHAADSKDAVVLILGAPTSSKQQEYLGIAYEELTWAPAPSAQISMTFLAGRLISKTAVIK